MRPPPHGTVIFRFDIKIRCTTRWSHNQLDVLLRRGFIQHLNEIYCIRRFRVSCLSPRLTTTGTVWPGFVCWAEYANN